MKMSMCVGRFDPLHQGHLEMIMRAKKKHDRCCVVVCDFAEDESAGSMPLTKRTQLVREFFMGDDLVSVMGVDCCGWEEMLDEFVKRTGESMDDVVVYVQDAANAARLKNCGVRVAEWDNVDAISSIEVRQHPLRYWHQIAAPFRPYLTKNILVIGTASEGKSTLVSDISKYFNLTCTQEWARVYMEQHALLDEELAVEDFVEFLTGQVRLYQEAVLNATRGVMIADTDNLVTLMYALSYVRSGNFNLTQADYVEVLLPLAWALRKVVRWDKIFVVVPGGVYVDDGFRYMGQSSMDERMANHHILMNLLEEFGLTDRVIYLQGGAYLDNFNIVKTYIDGLLS